MSLLANEDGDLAALLPEPSARLCRRANRLAHALIDLRLGAGARVVVACCDAHGEDGAVAEAAIAAISGVSIRVSKGEVVESRPDLVLACQEGYGWWNRSGVAARVVSDAPGTLWWRVLENTHPDTPLPPPGPVFVDRLPPPVAGRARLMGV